MNPEQLLIVARIFCAHYRTTVTDFAALCAAASASTARIEGIPVHATAEQAAAALEKCLLALPCLRSHNAEFARFCKQTLLRRAANR